MSRRTERTRASGSIRWRAVARRIRSDGRRSALRRSPPAASARCCSPAAPRTPRRTRGSPPGANAQKIQNLQWPVFLIAGIVGVIVFAVVGYVRVPLPRPRPGDPRADPRQAGARDRPHDPAGADPHRRRHPHRQHADRARQDRRHPVRRQRHRPAVVVGVSTTRCRTAAAASPSRSSPAARWSSRPTPTCSLRGTSRDVIHSLLDPELNGKRDMVPGRVQTLRMRGRPARHLRRPVHRVLRPLPRQHAHGGRRPDPPTTSRRGRPTSSPTYEPAEAGTLAAEGEAHVHRSSARAATRSTASPTPTATR